MAPYGFVSPVVMEKLAGQGSPVNPGTLPQRCPQHLTALAATLYEAAHSQPTAGAQHDRQCAEAVREL